MLHRDRPKVLPDSSSLDTLCDTIANIRSRFVIKDADCHVAEQPFIGNTMQCFTPTTTSEIRTIIQKVSN